MKLVCELPLPPPELSAQRNVHYMARARATRRYREDAKILFSIEKMRARWVGDKPVAITIEYRHTREAVGYHATDIANAIHACKPAIDGMVDAKIVKNDTKRWVKIDGATLLTSLKELGPKKPGVTIIVEEL